MHNAIHSYISSSLQGIQWCFSNIFCLVQSAVRLNLILLKPSNYDIDPALKVPVFGVFLIRIFSYSDWIRRDKEYLSVFSTNAEIDRPEKLQIRTLFTRCEFLLSFILNHLKNTMKDTLSTVLKTSNKNVRSNVFWYV